MRKNLYWIMIPLYFIVFAAVLFLNGIFSGEDIFSVNLVINICFLIVIGIFILMSCSSLRQLMLATDELNAFSAHAEVESHKYEGSLWEYFEKQNSFFTIKELKEGFSRYKKSVDKGISSRRDISEFINISTMDRIGQAQFNSALAGVFTGLGILGTFLGLSFGMMSFSGDDIFTISDNVGPLLGGMKVAFHTSVYGMVLSLVFTIIYRSMLAYVYASLDHFHIVFRECVAPYDQEDPAKVSLYYQSQMLNVIENMNKFIEGSARNQVAAINEMMNNFTNEVSRSVSVDFRNIAVALEKTVANQGVFNANIKELSDETRALMESCQIMKSQLDKSYERDEVIRKKIADSCNRLSAEVYTMNNILDKE